MDSKTKTFGDVLGWGKNEEPDVRVLLFKSKDQNILPTSIYHPFHYFVSEFFYIKFGIEYLSIAKQFKLFEQSWNLLQQFCNHDATDLDNCKHNPVEIDKYDDYTIVTLYNMGFSIAELHEIFSAGLASIKHKLLLLHALDDLLKDNRDNGSYGLQFIHDTVLQNINSIAQFINMTLDTDQNNNIKDHIYNLCQDRVIKYLKVYYPLLSQPDLLALHEQIGSAIGKRSTGHSRISFYEVLDGLALKGRAMKVENIDDMKKWQDETRSYYSDPDLSSLMMPDILEPHKTLEFLNQCYPMNNGKPEFLSQLFSMDEIWILRHYNLLETIFKIPIPIERDKLNIPGVSSELTYLKNQALESFIYKIKVKASALGEPFISLLVTSLQDIEKNNLDCDENIQKLILGAVEVGSKRNDGTTNIFLEKCGRSEIYRKLWQSIPDHSNWQKDLGIVSDNDKKLAEEERYKEWKCFLEIGFSVEDWQQLIDSKKMEILSHPFVEKISIRVLDLRIDHQTIKMINIAIKHFMRNAQMTIDNNGELKVRKVRFVEVLNLIQQFTIAPYNLGMDSVVARIIQVAVSGGSLKNAHYILERTNKTIALSPEKLEYIKSFLPSKEGKDKKITQLTEYLRVVFGNDSLENVLYPIFASSLSDIQSLEGLLFDDLQNQLPTLPMDVKKWYEELDKNYYNKFANHLIIGGCHLSSLLERRVVEFISQAETTNAKIFQYWHEKYHNMPYNDKIYIDFQTFFKFIKEIAGGDVQVFQRICKKSNIDIDWGSLLKNKNHLQLLREYSKLYFDDLQVSRAYNLKSIDLSDYLLTAIYHTTFSTPYNNDIPSTRQNCSQWLYKLEERCYGSTDYLIHQSIFDVEKIFTSNNGQNPVSERLQNLILRMHTASIPNFMISELLITYLTEYEQVEREIENYLVKKSNYQNLQNIINKFTDEEKKALKEHADDNKLAYIKEIGFDGFNRETASEADKNLYDMVEAEYQALSYQMKGSQDKILSIVCQKIEDVTEEFIALPTMFNISPDDYKKLARTLMIQLQIRGDNNINNINLSKLSSFWKFIEKDEVLKEEWGTILRNWIYCAGLGYKIDTCCELIIEKNLFDRISSSISVLFTKYIANSRVLSKILLKGCNFNVISRHILSPNSNYTVSDLEKIYNAFIEAQKVLGTDTLPDENISTILDCLIDIQKNRAQLAVLKSLSNSTDEVKMYTDFIISAIRSGFPTSKSGFEQFITQLKNYPNNRERAYNLSLESLSCFKIQLEKLEGIYKKGLEYKQALYNKNIEKSRAIADELLEHWGPSTLQNQEPILLLPGSFDPMLVFNLRVGHIKVSALSELFHKTQLYNNKYKEFAKIFDDLYDVDIITCQDLMEKIGHKEWIHYIYPLLSDLGAAGTQYNIDGFWTVRDIMPILAKYPAFNSRSMEYFLIKIANKVSKSLFGKSHIIIKDPATANKFLLENCSSPKKFIIQEIKRNLGKNIHYSGKVKRLCQRYYFGATTALRNSFLGIPRALFYFVMGIIETIRLSLTSKSDIILPANVGVFKPMIIGVHQAAFTLKDFIKGLVFLTGLVVLPVILITYTIYLVLEKIGSLSTTFAFEGMKSVIYYFSDNLYSHVLGAIFNRNINPATLSNSLLFSFSSEPGVGTSVISTAALIGWISTILTAGFMVFNYCRLFYIFNQFKQVNKAQGLLINREDKIKIVSGAIITALPLVLGFISFSTIDSLLSVHSFDNALITSSIILLISTVIATMVQFVLTVSWNTTREDIEPNISNICRTVEEKYLLSMREEHQIAEAAILSTI